MPHANRPQMEFLALPQKFKAYVGGYGSGKTWAGAMLMCAHFWEHPRVTQGYLAPTFPIIRDVFFNTVEEVAADFELRVDIKEGNKECHFYNGRTYRGTTICRSMENPDSIIGFSIGNALVDELDTLPMNKAEKVWRKVIARLRVKKGAHGEELKNGIAVTTTPEGFRQTHKLFVSAVAENPALAQNYGLVQASTFENEMNLPESYIPSLRETYTKELINAYLLGQFTNLTAGTVYRTYNRLLNGSSQVIVEREPLFIGMDFNVQHMAATVFVQRANGWHAVAELKDVFDSPDMIKIIKERWKDKGHRIIVYPDASARGRETVDASKSDIALLEQARFEVRANPSNPSVKDRVNAVNAGFEKGRLWVNVRACPTVAKCLEGQTYTEDGEPEKGIFDHQNDALGYAWVYENPVVFDRVHRVRIGGV